MKEIKILDCTLRDGGYINDFAFGERAITNVIDKLSSASIDIIECGFLKSGVIDPNLSLYGSAKAARAVIKNKNPNLLYVAMIQYGAIGIEEIEDCGEDTIDGIRVTFHQHEIDDAFILGKQLIHKGYRVFMQPVGTTSYSDSELLRLIEKVNQLMPYGFYMVDTLGTMYRSEVQRMFYLIDRNLDKRINLGFHSHNNLQMSFSNAQELVSIETARTVILDSSIYGMGRGAGNLCTELIAEYVNCNVELKYDIIPVLEAMDEYIKPLSLQYKWGYDAAYFISSTMKCHPNYASFLLNLQTLHVQDIYSILSNMDESKQTLFDKEYIACKYMSYMNNSCDDSDTIEKLRAFIGEREIVLIAPGPSIKVKENIDRILNYSHRKNCAIISVNFIPKNIPIDVLFVSNMKRFDSIEAAVAGAGGCAIVATSNIPVGDGLSVYRANYASYLNEENCIVDNAGLMCINLLKKTGVKKITMAGFDGFSDNQKDNFYDSSMIIDVEAERLKMINLAMGRKLKQLRTNLEIGSLTATKYE